MNKFLTVLAVTLGTGVLTLNLASNSEGFQTALMLELVGIALLACRAFGRATSRMQQKVKEDVEMKGFDVADEMAAVTDQFRAAGNDAKASGGVGQAQARSGRQATLVAA